MTQTEKVRIAGGLARDCAAMGVLVRARRYKKSGRVAFGVIRPREQHAVVEASVAMSVLRSVLARKRVCMVPGLRMRERTEKSELSMCSDAGSGSDSDAPVPWDVPPLVLPPRARPHPALDLAMGRLGAALKSLEEGDLLLSTTPVPEEAEEFDEGETQNPTEETAQTPPSPRRK